MYYLRLRSNNERHYVNVLEEIKDFWFNSVSNQNQFVVLCLNSSLAVTRSKPLCCEHFFPSEKTKNYNVRSSD